MPTKRARKSPAETKAMRLKNANVLSCRPSIAAINALREEAARRGVTYSRMVALALEERYVGVASSDM